MRPEREIRKAVAHGSPQDAPFSRMRYLMSALINCFDLYNMECMANIAGQLLPTAIRLQRFKKDLSCCENV